MEHNELEQIYPQNCERCKQYKKEIESLQIELIKKIAQIEKLSLDNERLTHEKSIERFFNKEGILLVLKVIIRKILTPIRRIIFFFI